MRYKINLFPPPEQTFVDKVIFFSFNYVRYILVITQLVVLAVFAYRFSVDQEIIDLKDALKQKQEIIKVSAPLIEQAQVLDYKTSNIDSLLDKQDGFSAMLKYYLERFPEKVTAESIQMGIDEIELKGTATEVPTIQSFYNRLKKENRFKLIELRDLQKTDTGYSFTLMLQTYVK